MLKIKKNGMTLIEILVTIAIMVILAAGLYSAGNYVETQAKIKLAESTIVILSTSLEQYHDFYGKFPFEAGAGYNRLNLKSTTEPNGIGGTVKAYGGTSSGYGSHKDEYSSIEALYYFLNKCPSSRTIVNSIHSSLLTNKSETKNEEFRIAVGTVEYPLPRVIDPWGKAMRYTYEDEDNFPVITSAGPDKDFGTTDDNITSR